MNQIIPGKGSLGERLKIILKVDINTVVFIMVTILIIFVILTVAFFNVPIGIPYA
jgi:hypothetical protein